MLKQITKGRVWRGRGRFSNRRDRGRLPRGMHSHKDRRLLAYLARIAVKNKVDSHTFFSAILDAWHHGESQCNQLSIVCRKKTQESAIFLFTIDRRVVAQFPISTAILQGRNDLEEYVRLIYSSPQIDVANPQIEDLKVGMKKVSLTAKVVEIPKPIQVYTRWGSMASVSNALIADDTGSIRMSLWNHQITMIAQGDAIQIEKGKVTRFRGELQLRIGRAGSLSVIE